MIVNTANKCKCCVAPDFIVECRMWRAFTISATKNEDGTRTVTWTSKYLAAAPDNGVVKSSNAGPVGGSGWYSYVAIGENGVSDSDQLYDDFTARDNWAVCEGFNPDGEFTFVPENPMTSWPGITSLPSDYWNAFKTTADYSVDFTYGGASYTATLPAGSILAISRTYIDPTFVTYDENDEETGFEFWATYIESDLAKWTIK